MQRKKRIGIGFEFYKEFMDKNLYYVDKTLLIRDLFEKGAKVNLFTRPRRFGKTLALTMLKAFFEQELDREGNIIDKSPYFADKKIWKEEGYAQHMGRYPVIFLSLKSAKQPDLVLSPFTPKETAIIIELKRADKFSQMDALCDAALTQIEEKNYAAELLDFGYQKILKYGICFCRKTCRIKKKE